MAIIPKITDVYVTIDITHPQTTVGLKNPAIFVSGDTQSYKEYTYLEQLEADVDNEKVIAMAQTIFEQDPAPEAIAVITYAGTNTNKHPKLATPANVKATPTTDGAIISADDIEIGEVDPNSLPNGGIEKAVYDYFYNNWEFALLADYKKEDALALADTIEHGGYDGKGFHICFLQFNEDNRVDAKEFAQFTRTFTFYHTADESYAAALAASGAQPTIGKTSWKFVSDLVGITPENISASEIIKLQNENLICYVTKANNSNQTDDKNASGMYIDTVHGLDQVKTLVENNLQNSLNTAGKTPYDATGLGMIAASLENTLGLCYNNGIIATGADGKAMYSSSVPNIANIKRADIGQRVLKNVKFNYTPSSAINTIYVRGNMQAWL